MELFKAISDIHTWWQLAALIIVSLALIIREAIRWHQGRLLGDRHVTEDRLKVTVGIIEDHVDLKIARHCAECANIVLMRAEIQKIALKIDDIWNYLVKP